MLICIRNRFPNIFHRKLEMNNACSTYIAKCIPNTFQKRKFETNNATFDQLIACLWNWKCTFTPRVKMYFYSKSQNVFLLLESKCTYDSRETTILGFVGNDKNQDILFSISKPNYQSLVRRWNQRSVFECTKKIKNDNYGSESTLSYVIWLYTAYTLYIIQYIIIIYFIRL